LFHVMGLPSKQAMLPMLGLPHTVLTCHWRLSGTMVGVGCIVCMLGGASLGGQTWPTSGGTWIVSCHGPPKQASHAPHALSSSDSFNVSLEGPVVQWRGLDALFAWLGGPLWEGKHGPEVGGLGLFHVMGLPSKLPMLPMLGLRHIVLTCHLRPSGAMEGDRCIVCMLGGASLGGQAWPTSGGTWFVSCHGPPKQAPHAPHERSFS
jgi:hypothetical protein